MSLILTCGCGGTSFSGDTTFGTFCDRCGQPFGFRPQAANPNAGNPLFDRDAANRLRWSRHNPGVPYPKDRH